MTRLPLGSPATSPLSSAGLVPGASSPLLSLFFCLDNKDMILFILRGCGRQNDGPPKEAYVPILSTHEDVPLHGKRAFVLSD